jgi:O-antigen chain-terminating methyltransferase
MPDIDETNGAVTPAALQASGILASDIRQLVDNVRFSKITGQADYPTPSSMLSVRDFLHFHDQHFVDFAYGSILGRAPDAVGREYYLQQLRQGEDKCSILVRLRYSPEGRARAVKIKGLVPHLISHALGRAPILGGFVEWTQSLLALRAHKSSLSRFEAFMFSASERRAQHVDDVINRICDHIERLSSHLSGCTDRLDQLAQVTSEINNRLGSNWLTQVIAGSTPVRELQHNLSALAEQVTRWCETVDQEKAGRVQADEHIFQINTQVQTLQNDMEQKFSAYLEFVQRMEHANADLQQKFSNYLEVSAYLEFVQRFEYANADLQRSFSVLHRSIERKLARVSEDGKSNGSIADILSEWNRLYASLEDQFRGSPELIQGRLQIYLDKLKSLFPAGLSKPLVDIGCGRGDWLTLLKQSNIDAIGVETNDILVDRCHQAGLRVIQTNALDYLWESDDESVAVVSCFHVIEHLPQEAVYQLLSETMRVLQPSGILIIETPNPENLQVGATNFYLDPTHRHPLPPALVKFSVEAYGYEVVESLWLNPPEHPPELGEGPAAAALARYLFGPMDFGLIARKPPQRSQPL